MKFPSKQTQLTTYDSPIHVNIDGDPIVYASAFVGQSSEWKIMDGKKLVEKGFGTKSQALKRLGVKHVDDYTGPYHLIETVMTSDLSAVFHTVKCMFQTIIDQCNAGTYSIFLTGKGNYRDGLATIKKYKAGRPTKPKLYPEVRGYILEKLGAELIEGMEADDKLSILSWDALRELKQQYPEEGVDSLVDRTNVVLASIDKDLRQVPGLYFNPGWNKDYDPEGEDELITPKKVYKLGSIIDNGKKVEFQGLKGFYMQMLTGDSCDAIKGIKGCGPKGALKLLVDTTSEQEMFNIVRKEYTRVLGESWEYYKWDQYVDPDASDSRAVLKEGAVTSTMTVLERMYEVGNLLYMLRREPRNGEVKEWAAFNKFK